MTLVFLRLRLNRGSTDNPPLHEVVLLQVRLIRASNGRHQSCSGSLPRYRPYVLLSRCRARGGASGRDRHARRPRLVQGGTRRWNYWKQSARGKEWWVSARMGASYCQDQITGLRPIATGVET